MSHPSTRLSLFDFELSGHCHRVRLMMSLLDLPFDSTPVDLAGGEHKRAAFLGVNPLGQVPVLRDGDITISDSTAILVYLAAKFDAAQWLPHEPARAAEVQRWLSIASGEMAHGLARARSAVLFGFPYDLQAATTLSHVLLERMDEHLRHSDFLVGSAPSLADIACYSYAAHAPEGRVSLEPYAQVRRWLAHVEALPRFVAMPRTAVPAAA